MKKEGRFAGLRRWLEVAAKMGIVVFGDKEKRSSSGFFLSGFRICIDENRIPIDFYRLESNSHPFDFY